MMRERDVDAQYGNGGKRQEHFIRKRKKMSLKKKGDCHIKSRITELKYFKLKKKERKKKLTRKSISKQVDFLSPDNGFFVINYTLETK